MRRATGIENDMLATRFRKEIRKVSSGYSPMVLASLTFKKNVLARDWLGRRFLSSGVEPMSVKVNDVERKALCMRITECSGAFCKSWWTKECYIVLGHLGQLPENLHRYRTVSNVILSRWSTRDE